MFYLAQGGALLSEKVKIFESPTKEYLQGDINKWIDEEKAKGNLKEIISVSLATSPGSYFHALIAYSY